MKPTKENDIVTDILQRAMDVVRAELGPSGLESATLDAVIARIGALEKPVRHDWRGTVAQRNPAQVEQAKQAALDEVRRTGRVAEAGSRYGISRATLYRLLERR